MSEEKIELSKGQQKALREIPNKRFELIELAREIRGIRRWLQSNLSAVPFYEELPLEHLKYIYEMLEGLYEPTWKISNESDLIYDLVRLKTHAYPFIHRKYDDHAKYEAIEKKYPHLETRNS